MDEFELDMQSLKENIYDLSQANNNSKQEIKRQRIFLYKKLNQIK